MEMEDQLTPTPTQIKIIAGWSHSNIVNDIGFNVNNIEDDIEANVNDIEEA